MITKELDGSYTLQDEADPSRALRVPADADIEAQIAAFFATSLAMPDDVPMHQLRMFLIATNRLGQVQAFLNSLPDPQKALANSEFEYAPTFVPTGALGRACQAALKLSDADYAEAVRDAAQFRVEDYGDPKPTLLRAIQKFFTGG